jgi:hypothetical protein
VPCPGRRNTSGSGAMKCQLRHELRRTRHNGRALSTLAGYVTKKGDRPPTRLVLLDAWANGVADEVAREETNEEENEGCQRGSHGSVTSCHRARPRLVS